MSGDRSQPEDAAEPQGGFLAQYSAVRALARRLLVHDRGRHSLGATELAHEAWLRLVGRDLVSESPEQFRRLVIVAMRHALIDRARARGSQKRGGGAAKLPLDAFELASGERFEDLLAVDEAIERLRERSPEAAELVRLRFFAGLTVEETAATLGTSERSVQRDWVYARAQLVRLLGADLGD